MSGIWTDPTPWWRISHLRNLAIGAGVCFEMWWFIACSPSFSSPPEDLFLPIIEPLAPVDPCADLPEADGFDFPVGGGSALDYYDAQPFGKNLHLGSDWNAHTGGNSDFGAPVLAIGAGRVTVVEDVGGGWGLVVRIAHRADGRCIESLYAHLSASDVAVGASVVRGATIGAIGDAGGIYYAHLHFEIRDTAALALGGGYGEPFGQVDPTAFIEGRRPVASVRSPK